MSKVITFSRTYPSYHTRSGQPTDFVEKIHWGITPTIFDTWKCASDMLRDLNKHLPEEMVQDFIDSLDDDSDYSDIIKYHTMREGHRFKAGDWFSPRVWGNNVNPKSGKSGPYHSKQIIIAPDMQVKKTWEVKMIKNGYKEFYVNNKLKNGSRICMLAKNDGLTTDNLHWWFNKPFEGQIICWNESIEY